MDKTQPLLEQLFLAGEQLHNDSTSYARFSLLLTDNVVELLAHRKVLGTVYRGGPEHGRRSSIIEEYADEVKKATGQDFAEKLKFLRRHGFVSMDQSEFAIEVHRLRGKVYHQGMRDEPILRAVAWEYHEMACELFAALTEPYSISGFSNSQPTTTIVGITNAVNGFDFGSISWLKAVAGYLQKAKPAYDFSLSDVLAKFLDERLTEMMSMLEVIAEESDQSLEQALHNVLFLDQFDFDAIETDPGDLTMGDVFSRAKAAFSPPATLKKLRRWSERTNRLSRAEDSATAMQQYVKLVLDIEDVETSIWRRGFHHDLWGDHQFNMTRDEGGHK